MQQLYIFAEKYAKPTKEQECFGESTFNKPHTPQLDSQISVHHLLSVRIADQLVKMICIPATDSVK
jgi:hypothetical protein